MTSYIIFILAIICSLSNGFTPMFLKFQKRNMMSTRLIVSNSAVMKLCFKSDECTPEYCCEMVPNLIYICCDDPLKSKEFKTLQQLKFEPILIPIDNQKKWY